jgi:hypothetical protein
MASNAQSDITTQEDRASKGQDALFHYARAHYFSFAPEVPDITSEIKTIAKDTLTDIFHCLDHVGMTEREIDDLMSSAKRQFMDEKIMHESRDEDSS